MQLQVDGLADAGPAAGCERRPLVLVSAVHGDGDNRYVVRLGASQYPACGLVTVEHRHRQIHQDEVTWPLPILDAKYVPENASRSLIVEKIAAGFHQVYRYCEDFNKPEGFLVCFNRTPKRITLKLEEADGLNYLRIGGRMVYYLAVSISDEPTASRSGRAEDVHIASEELVSAGG